VKTDGERSAGEKEEREAEREDATKETHFLNSHHRKPKHRSNNFPKCHTLDKPVLSLRPSLHESPSSCDLREKIDDRANDLFDGDLLSIRFCRSRRRGIRG